MISEGTTDAIFSLESEDGSSLSPSPSGNGQSGPAPARASRSALPAKAPGKRTPDTCGPLFTASSPSADLQRCLASRLADLMDCSGSPEYALTWREVDMPWGPPICRLRASGRRTFGSGFGGWPTPDASAMNDGESLESFERRRTRLKQDYANGNGAGRPLGIAAQMAGWPTPMAGGGGTTESERATEALAGGHERPSEQGKYLKGWPTPMSRDGEHGGRRINDGKRGAGSTTASGARG